MYRAAKMDSSKKDDFYPALLGLLGSLVDYETDWLANLANAAGLLSHQLDDINWAGFYLVKGGELVLGPYGGKPACSHIEFGEGVCGAAAADQKTVVVADVYDFPGHIACDEASQSEIVVPVFSGGRLVAVLDIDSPVKRRFDERDARGLEAYAARLAEHVDWSKIG